MSEPSRLKQVASTTQKALVKLVEDVRLTHYGFIFVAIVLLFASAYYILTPSVNGIDGQCVHAADFTYWDATYFSVVTISSLGYGDFHPVGLSKYLAGIQVLCGLLLMGIMLAKLTSFRLAYHVSKLYGADLQKRLERFASDFELLGVSLKESIRELGECYRETPGSTPREADASIVAKFSELLGRLHTRCADLGEYVLKESEFGGFFANVPLETLLRAVDNLEDDVYLLGQLIIGLPTRGRTEVLDRTNRRRTSEITARLCELSDRVEKRTKEPKILAAFVRVKEKCVKISEAYYSRPEVISEREQPDQRLDTSDEPQSGSDLDSGEHR